jgi:hypothetical protein
MPDLTVLRGGNAIIIVVITTAPAKMLFQYPGIYHLPCPALSRGNLAAHRIGLVNNTRKSR